MSWYVKMRNPFYMESMFQTMIHVLTLKEWKAERGLMGKKGDALRAAKMQNTVYTMTRAQMEAHDKAVREQAIRARAKEMEGEAVKLARSIISEWTDDDTGELDVPEIVRYMLAITIKVLIDKFGWKKVPVNGKPDDKRHKIVKYALYVDEEIDKLKNYGTIKEYSQKVIDQYGIGFITETIEKTE